MKKLILLSILCLLSTSCLNDKSYYHQAIFGPPEDQINTAEDYEKLEKAIEESKKAKNKKQL